MYNEIALEMFKREPNCTEVILHPLLRVLEVNAKTLPLVLENGYNLNKLTTLYLFFDINRCVALVPQFLSFMGSLSYLTHLKVHNRLFGAWESFSLEQPFQVDLNKKLDPKQNTFQTINIDAQGFRKTKNENPLAQEIGVTS